MARPALPSRSCEPEMKWVLKTNINVDPAVLAKNLTILCTVAFSATVLYVMYSNGSKRPSQLMQDEEDEESSDEDHSAVECKTQCRHSIVGNSDRTRPPDVVQSPSSHCPLDAQMHTSTVVTTDEKSCGTDAGFDDAQTQTVPEMISVATESFDDSIQSLLTLVEPSTMSSASGPDQIVSPSQASSCSQTLPVPTTSTGSGPDSSCLRSDPGCTRAKNEGESSWEEIDAMGKDGNHFEGYIFGMIREKGGKSYKETLRGGVSSERRQQGEGVRFKEACSKLANGVEVCEDVSTTGERPQKIVSPLSGPECSIPRQRDSCTQTSEVKAEKATGMYGSREAVCSGRPLKQLHVTTMDNDFECGDKGVIDFVDSCSASKKECVRRPLARLPTNLPKAAENIDRRRDQVSSKSVGNFPQIKSRGAWTGRPCKQHDEASCHLKDSGFGVDKTMPVEERIGREDVQSEPTKDHRNCQGSTTSSLAALTETEHWSKMSLAEQYAYLVSLDSTLKTASAELKGKTNVTYWRHKDSDPGPSKLSGISSVWRHKDLDPGPSLCKSQGGDRSSGSTECPTMDKAHLHVRGDSNCTNIANSGRGQCRSEVACEVEAREVHRALLSSHNHQVASPFTAGDDPVVRSPRSVQNNSLHDDLIRRANIIAECQRVQSEAARETRQLKKILAKNCKRRYL